MVRAAEEMLAMMRLLSAPVAARVAKSGGWSTCPCSRVSTQQTLAANTNRRMTLPSQTWSHLISWHALGHVFEPVVPPYFRVSKTGVLFGRSSPNAHGRCIIISVFLRGQATARCTYTPSFLQKTRLCIALNSTQRDDAF